MAKCPLCSEKQIEIDRILAAYKADKIMYRKIIIIGGVVLLLLAAFGKDGLTMALDIFKGIIQ